MKPCTRVVVGIAVVLIVGSCGGSSSDTSSSAPTVANDSVSATAESTVTDPAAPTSDPASATSAAATTTTPPPATAPPQELADLVAITEIIPTTPASGNGERPLFAWESVDSAANYFLVLTRADGQAYWAWSGPESQIWLGGLVDEPPAEATGPYMVEPMTLRVFATDAEGAIFAASQPTEIAP